MSNTYTHPCASADEAEQISLQVVNNLFFSWARYILFAEANGFNVEITFEVNPNERNTFMRNLTSFLNESSEIYQLRTFTLKENIGHQYKRRKIVGDKKPTAPLVDFQEEGVNWLIKMYEHGINCLLADDHGLGKKTQVIAMLESINSVQTVGRILIIAQNIQCRDFWSFEATMCGFGVTFNTNVLTKQLVITTTESYSKNIEDFGEVWDIVVIEATNMESLYDFQHLRFKHLIMVSEMNGKLTCCQYLNLLTPNFKDLAIPKHNRDDICEDMFKELFLWRSRKGAVEN